MFKDPKRQGSFLTNLFTFIFSSIENEAKCRKVLEELAISHVHKGVKSCEYGIIGEVIFWTLKTVMRNDYTFAIHTAWVKIFSSMLRIILPISVHHELRSNSSQLKRVEEFESLSSKKTTKMSQEDNGSFENE